MKSRSFSIIVIFIALALLGCALISRLPVKLMPSRTLPSLSVSFSMPDVSARVVESEVTSKLESMLARVGGIKEITSTSSNGSGYISLMFDKNADMQQARFEVSAIIRQAWSQLPDGVSYPAISATRTIRQSSRPILSYVINAPGAASAIMQYAEENIRPAIGIIPGVNRVALSGATPMEWRLTYDSDLLRVHGLTPGTISSAIAEQTSARFLGTATTGTGEWLAVQTIMAGREEFDISKICITAPDGTVMNLSRLATAEHVDARPTGYFRINGLNSIYCNVYADEEANQLEVAAKVKAAVATLNLPKDYSLTLSGDVTEHIVDELNKIYFRTGLTLLILLVFVALITLNLRYMLVITVSLLLSLSISVIFYYLARIEFQLYSLAGITISLNLIIDNIIVVSDHYRRKRDLRVFTSVLAATLTTIGALSIVFFLENELRLNLRDFVMVVIINLAVSLATALWLVPALLERIGVADRVVRSRRRVRRLRLIARFNRCYASYIRFGRRWRRAILAVVVLIFGLPVFMIPKEKCSETYNEKVRPWVNTIFGGTLRLFVENVYEGSYFNRKESEPTLQISASLPNGATLEQMNELIKKMESFLAGYAEISRFRTDVYSPRRADISVSFTREAARSGFPYQLKSETIRKALSLGGGSWAVYGLEDLGFNNSVQENSGSYRVKMLGYNYDELEALAEQFRRKLLGHRRIKEVTISSEFSWAKDDYTEFYLSLDRDAMARCNINVGELYAALSPVLGRDMQCATTVGTAERILLSSHQGSRYDVWALMNMPFTSGNKTFRLLQFATIDRLNAPRTIAKENQQYILCLQYEYIGSYVQGHKMLEDDVKEFAQTLPMGYSIHISDNSYRWSDASANNYWLLLLVAAIIFWITAILFNSVAMPLVIVLTIPISFIGLFLGFYLTHMNFDQGGFAAFVLLCGITVNAAIYLISEYRRSGNYLRAFNAKIIPILLTVVSTILGFIPFMVGPDSPEAFWFPLALGTISGLLTSLLALLIILPLFFPAPAVSKRN